jgi:hypothetical protein
MLCCRAWQMLHANLLITHQAPVLLTHHLFTSNSSSSSNTCTNSSSNTGNSNNSNINSSIDLYRCIEGCWVLMKDVWLLMPATILVTQVLGGIEILGRTGGQVQNDQLVHPFQCLELSRTAHQQEVLLEMLHQH